jgi:hypothetical protein
MNEKQEIFSLIKEYEKFQDPLTGYYPSNEVELSAVLGFLMKSKQLNLNQIPLYKVIRDNQYELCNPEMSLNSLVKDNPIVLEEYPLMYSKQNEKRISQWGKGGEVDTWGGMRIDLLLLSLGYSTVLIENKIGSNFTSGGTQLQRQVYFLNNYGIGHKNLIILSSKSLFDKGYYFSNICNLSNISEIDLYIICWEDIFNATN